MAYATSGFIDPADLTDAELLAVFPAFAAVWAEVVAAAALDEMKEAEGETPAPETA